MSYAHSRPVTRQITQDTQQVGKVLLRHAFGIAVTVVALLFTAGLVLAFLFAGWDFAAVMSGLIGLLATAVGITYHATGE